MSEQLPPVVKRVFDFSVSKGWVPKWLADFLRGGAGGALVVAILAITPLGNQPEPAPTVAPPTAGKFYTEAEIETMVTAYRQAGFRDALVTIGEAIDPARVEESRGVIKNLLEDASK